MGGAPAQYCVSPSLQAACFTRRLAGVLCRAAVCHSDGSLALQDLSQVRRRVAWALVVDLPSLTTRLPQTSPTRLPSPAHTLMRDFADPAALFALCDGGTLCRINSAGDVSYMVRARLLVSRVQRHPARLPSHLHHFRSTLPAPLAFPEAHSGRVLGPPFVSQTPKALTVSTSLWGTRVQHSCVCYMPVLFCSVLFCSVLFCSVLFCSVLFCSCLFCSVLFCSDTLSHGADLQRARNSFYFLAATLSWRWTRPVPSPPLRAVTCRLLAAPGASPLQRSRTVWCDC